MEHGQLNSIGLASNDGVIAAFCIAISLLVAIGAQHLKGSPYFRCFAASLSFFLILTAASVLKSLAPKYLGLVEHIAILLSTLSITTVAYKYRKVAKELK
jgi:hypothetical protein